MNEIINALKERRSIRSFTDEVPSKEVIDEIIGAGLYAPSGMGKQSSIILVVDNPELDKKIREDNRKIAGFEEGKDPFYGAPVILIVLGNKESMTNVYDGSCTMQNLMLAAHSLGLGTVWVHRAKQEFEMPEYQELLKKNGIEGEYEGIGHVALGYIDGEVPAPKERKENRVFYVK